MSIKVCQLELSENLTALSFDPSYLAVWFLVRLHDYPLGYLKLPLEKGQITLEQLKKGLTDQLSPALVGYLTGQVLAKEGLKPHNFTQFQSSYAVSLKTSTKLDQLLLPSISIAICTRDRPHSLQRCLESLTQLDYPNFEIIVVDNAPKTNQTALLMQQWTTNPVLAGKLRYVPEPKPGLSWGRNRAILEANGELIAYTDDDVVLDKNWLTALAHAFSDPAVGCVTGLVVPLELETPAQELFEQYGGFGRGFVPKHYHFTSQPHPIYPMGAGIFGTGANVAFRRSIFAKIGLFETGLGPGTATAGCDDQEMFFRVLKNGSALNYEPSAIIYHQHRRDMAGLALQLRNFGRAEVAYFTHLYLKYPDERQRVRMIVRWWFLEHGLRRFVRQIRRKQFPLSLIWAEMRGSFGGVWAYRQAQRDARQIAKGQHQTAKMAALWEEGEKKYDYQNS